MILLLPSGWEIAPDQYQIEDPNISDYANALNTMVVKPDGEIVRYGDHSKEIMRLRRAEAERNVSEKNGDEPLLRLT